MTGLITSWSPSRLDKYEQCPRKAKYEIVDRLCPKCFLGKLHGGFGEPTFCDTCGAKIEDPEPIARGNDMHAAQEAFVQGKANKPFSEIRHPKVLALGKELRAEYKKGRVKVEMQVVLDRNWSPVSKYTKGAWFRGKIDIYHQMNGKEARVLDWKSGGINKSDGSVRVEAKYDDQLSIYNLIGLLVAPTVEHISAGLVFTDCGPRFEPIVERKALNLSRADVPKEKKRWEGKVKALLSDRVMAPRPNEKCKWCPFSKGKGGPCPYGA